MKKYYYETIKRNLHLILLAVPLQLISSICSILIPLSYQTLIDNIINQGRFELLKHYILIIGIIFLIFICSDILSNWAVIKCIAAFKEMLKEHVMEVVLKRNSDEMDKLGKGEIITRITQDVDTLVNIVAEYFIPTIVGIFMFGFMLIVIFRINFILGIISLAASPTFFLITRIFGKKIENQTRIVSKESEKFINIVDECIDANKVIRFYDCYNYENKRFHNILNCYIGAGKQFLLKNLYAKKTFTAMGTLFPLIILLIGTGLIVGGEISLGVLISVLSCLNYILMPATVLSNCIIGMKQFKVSNGRIQVFFGNDTVTDTGAAESEWHEGYGISAKDICFSFQNHEVFKNINFHIRDKEFISIVGKNGVGKSTMLNLLMGILQIDSGEIKIGGVANTRLNYPFLNKHISPVMQNEFLFDDSVLKNIYFDQSADCNRELTRELIENNICYKNAGKNGVNLSGGEKQKVVLARALKKNSEILIIDEGSTNFDLHNLELIYSLLKNIKGKKTIILIDHHMGYIQLSNRVLYIENKDNVYLEKHENLLEKNENYKKLYLKSVVR